MLQNVLLPGGILDKMFIVTMATNDPYSNPGAPQDRETKVEFQQPKTNVQLAEETREMIGGIAHDLNNILSPLSMILPALREECRNSMTLAMLDKFEAYTSTSADVVRQLVSIPDYILGQRIPLQTRHLLKSAGQFIRETLPKSVQIRSNIPFDLWLVEADRAQVRWVLKTITQLFCQAACRGNQFVFDAFNTQYDVEMAAEKGVAAGNYVVWSLACDRVVFKVKSGKLTTGDQSNSSMEPNGSELTGILEIVESHDGFIILEENKENGQAMNIHWPVAHSTQH